MNMDAPINEYHLKHWESWWMPQAIKWVEAKRDKYRKNYNQSIQKSDIHNTLIKEYQEFCRKGIQLYYQHLFNLHLAGKITENEMLNRMEVVIYIGEDYL